MVNFDLNNSPLKEVYKSFGVTDYFDLKEICTEEDQRLMYAGQWDYKNSQQLPNKIKKAIEKVGLGSIQNNEEKYWAQNILWLWYHHAISCALSLYGNKEAAHKYSEMALNLQPANHPNKITKLLYLLVRDKLTDAEEYAEEITIEPERTTAQYFLDKYRKGNFFKPDK